MKVLLSEKRTQVYFPVDLYRRIERKAKEESISSAAIIREAVEEYLKKEKEIDWENDSLFNAVGFFESESGDLSINHDAYLYGKRGKVVGKKK